MLPCAHVKLPCGCFCVVLQALTNKEKIAHMKASMSADVAKAIGRISSGLYIVAAQQENARRSALLLFPSAAREQIAAPPRSHQSTEYSVPACHVVHQVVRTMRKLFPACIFRC
jgi:hypothetical protein